MDIFRLYKRLRDGNLLTIAATKWVHENSGNVFWTFIWELIDLIFFFYLFVCYLIYYCSWKLLV